MWQPSFQSINKNIPLTKIYNEVEVICLLIFLLSSLPHVCHSDCTLFAKLLSIAFSSVHEYNPLSLYVTSCKDNWLQEGLYSFLSLLQLDMLYFPRLWKVIKYQISKYLFLMIVYIASLIHNIIYIIYCTFLVER